MAKVKRSVVRPGAFFWFSLKDQKFREVKPYGKVFTYAGYEFFMTHRKLEGDVEGKDWSAVCVITGNYAALGATQKECKANLKTRMDKWGVHMEEIIEKRARTTGLSPRYIWEIVNDSAA